MGETQQPGPRPGKPGPGGPGGILETTVSPFHCLYLDAFELHSLSRARQHQSIAEASRLARASLLLYLAAAEALVHQAAIDLGRAELSKLVADPSRPISLLDAWRLLPAIAAEAHGPAADPSSPPWPQFAELLALRDSWTHPGPADSRRAYYRRSPLGDAFEPMEPHQVPPSLSDRLPADRLVFPKTGFPRDPYAFAPRHLDTARAVLDAAISALDARLGGTLTRGNRHRTEPSRMIEG